MKGCYEWRTLASRKLMVATGAVRLYVLLMIWIQVVFFTYISSGRNTKHEGVEMAVYVGIDDFLGWPLL